ncbi:MAG: RNA polymerase sigma factor [Anaerolineales bacterium]|nr:RNA polymerase sigma factor [Anaerolineales bacterium]
MNSAEVMWLITECLAQNDAAIETLIHQYEAGVFRFALSIVGNQADAHEVTQETFIAALRSLHTYQEKKSFNAWLYTIALNHSRSLLRKRKVLEKLQATTTLLFRNELQRQSSPEETVIQTEKEAVVWNELNKMDEMHRIVVILRYFQELSIAEIAEVLNINEGTIHSRLHTARERLRKVLQPMYGE